MKPIKSMTANKKQTLTNLPKICTIKKKRASIIRFPLISQISLTTAVTHTVLQLPRVSFRDTQLPGSSSAPAHSQSTDLAVDKVTFTQNSTVENVFLSSATEVQTHSTLEGSGLPHGTCTRICCNSKRALTKRVCEWNDSTDPCSTSEIPGELCAPSRSEMGNSSQVLAPPCTGASCGSGRQMP